MESHYQMTVMTQMNIFPSVLTPRLSLVLTFAGPPIYVEREATVALAYVPSQRVDADVLTRATTFVT